jgi:uncharacterized protein
MTTPHGTPIWYELMTPDPDAAAGFYGHVVGWTVGNFDGPTIDGPADYRILSAPDGEGVAGLMPRPADGPAPGWYGYIGVDEVDAAAAKIVAGGGTVHMPPTTLPGVGRMAMLADPDGALFYLMKGESPEPSTSFKRGAAGHGEWHELYAADDQAALAFYAGQFGWTKQGTMPMGEMGDYSFISHDGGVIGAVMRAPPGERPRWNYFFRVGAIGDAKARIEERGGTLTYGPVEVPGGDWVIYALDPQGGHFGIVGSKD